MGESVNARVRGSQSRAAKSEEERMECRKRGERGGASRFGQDDGTGRCRGGIGVVSRAEECGVSVARPGGGFWVCEAGLSLGCGRSAIARLQKVARLGREGLEWPGTGRLGLSDRMRVETEACRLDRLAVWTGLPSGQLAGGKVCCGALLLSGPPSNVVGPPPGAHPNKKALR